MPSIFSVDSAVCILSRKIKISRDILINFYLSHNQVPSVSYPRLVQLLRIGCYSRPVLSGLVISMGGLQESLRRASVTALLEYFQASEPDTDTNEEKKTREYLLSTDFLWVLQKYQKCDRVITPTLKVSRYVALVQYHVTTMLGLSNFFCLHYFSLLMCKVCFYLSDQIRIVQYGHCFIMLEWSVGINT